MLCSLGKKYVRDPELVETLGPVRHFHVTELPVECCCAIKKLLTCP